MRILHTQADGALAITIPSPQYIEQVLAANPNMNYADVVQHIADKDCPASHEIVDVATVPTDRTFCNAWEHDTSAAPEKVKTNLPKAKLIAHEVRRSKRAEAFAPLDTQATIPSQANAAEAARQVIRDADVIKQTAIDSAATVADLFLAHNS